MCFRIKLGPEPSLTAISSSFPLQRVHTRCIQTLLYGHAARCQESWSWSGKAGGTPIAEWSAVSRTTGTWEGWSCPVTFSVPFLTTDQNLSLSPVKLMHLLFLHPVGLPSCLLPLPIPTSWNPLWLFQL